MPADQKRTVSIVVPVYNVEEYLPECIESVLEQSYRDIEVILVNDGSTDSSPAICKKYAQADHRIRFVTQRNMGLSAARNMGIDLCSGAWITFVDSDDRLRADAIECFVDASIQYKSEIVCGGFTHDSNVIDRANSDRSVRFQRYENAREVLHFSLVTNHAWGKLYSSSLFKNSGIRYPVGRRYEDIATTYRLFEKVSSIVVTEESLYWYRIRRDSITAVPTRKDISDLKDTYQEISRHYAEDTSDSCLMFQATVLYQLQRVAALSCAPTTAKAGTYKFVKNSTSDAMIRAAARHLNTPMGKKILFMKSGLLPLLLKVKHHQFREK